MTDPYIMIYHRVYARENFGDAAEALFTLVQDAVRKCPGQERSLYLDVDGHRKGRGWDTDADALLGWFVPGVLGRWLTRYLDADGNEVHNPDQRDDMPDGLYLTAKDGQAGPRVIGVDESDAAGKTVAVVAVRAGARL